MIIGIDLCSVVYGTGVSNYTINLIRNLLKKDRVNSYKLFFSSFRLPIPPEIEKLTKYPNVKLYQFRLPISFLALAWNRLRILPIELFIGTCDVFHTSDWTQPPTLRAKTLTTVHDLTPFLYPYWLHSKIVSTHSNKMYWAVKKCHHFICVSTNTKQDLLKIFPQIPEDKCTVIFEAAEDKYAQFQKLPQKKREAKIALIEKQYGLDRYILSQGTREPRKNLKNLIAAFNRFSRRFPGSKLELAISGKYGWGKDILHLKNSKIKILGYIPEKDMVPLHAAALFLAYPSFYEGFGLPLVKSMQVGVPVLTSNTSSLPEVAGPGGLLVNPASVTSIYQAMEKLANRPNLRKSLSQKALKHAQQFSWAKTATQTLAVYEKINS